MPQAIAIDVRIDGDGLDRDVKHLAATTGVQLGSFSEARILDEVKALVYAHTKVVIKRVGT